MKAIEARAATEHAKVVNEITRTSIDRAYSDMIDQLFRETSDEMWSTVYNNIEAATKTGNDQCKFDISELGINIKVSRSHGYMTLDHCFDNFEKQYFAFIKRYGIEALNERSHLVKAKRDNLLVSQLTNIGYEVQIADDEIIIKW